MADNIKMAGETIRRAKQKFKPMTKPKSIGLRVKRLIS